MMVQTTQTQPQISAHISEDAKIRLDRLARARGLRKSYMVEQALLYYMRALEELPEEAFLPPRLVVPPTVFQQVVEMIENPAPPTEALVELMHGNSDSSVAID